VCVFVCVCVRARVCVCVRVCMCICVNVIFTIFVTFSCWRSWPALCMHNSDHPYSHMHQRPLPGYRGFVFNRRLLVVLLLLLLHVLTIDLRYDEGGGGIHS